MWRTGLLAGEHVQVVAAGLPCIIGYTGTKWRVTVAETSYADGPMLAAATGAEHGRNATQGATPSSKIASTTPSAGSRISSARRAHWLETVN
jgi:hypothetical protein